MKRSMQPSEQCLQRPNLPQARVTAVAISETAGESIRKLASMGVFSVQIPAFSGLPDGLQSHADLQLFHVETSGIFVSEQLFDTIYNIGFQPLKVREPLGKCYPADARFNALRLGKRILCNPDTISREILEFAQTHEIEIVPVKQGYTKCSVCCVDEDLIITDDPSIYKSAQFFCNDLLLVSKGSIRLSGYHYGFIGGCCGKLDRDLIGWNGNIETHADAKQILDFLERHRIRSINLHDGPLTDIGSILPLKEKCHHQQPDDI